MRFVVVFIPDLEIVQQRVRLRTWVAANVFALESLNERLGHSV